MSGQSHDRPDPQSCNTLDPIRGCDFRYAIRCGAGENLMKFSEDMTPAPYLAAETPTVSEDSLTWTVVIRCDVYPSNGEKLTAGKDIEQILMDDSMCVCFCCPVMNFVTKKEVSGVTSHTCCCCRVWADTCFTGQPSRSFPSPRKGFFQAKPSLFPSAAGDKI